MLKRLTHPDMPVDVRNEISMNIHGFEAKVKQQQKLISELTEALMLDPTDATSLMERAEMHVLMNQKDKAIDDISRYIRCYIIAHSRPYNSLVWRPRILRDITNEQCCMT